MKTDTINKYMLLFCYAFFSFAVTVPPLSMDIHSWVKGIALSTAVLSLLSFFLFRDGETKQLANLFIILYLIILMSKQIMLINNYMKIYHRGTSMYADYIISAAVILMLTFITEKRMYKLAFPIMSIVIILIAMIVILNYHKFSPAALYKDTIKFTPNLYSVTLFDYLVPMYIIWPEKNKKSPVSAILFIITACIIFIVLTVFVSGCIKGSLLYSLSPLQSVFQISGTKQMKNYDALFNLMLYFSYFASIIVITAAYKKVKRSFGYFSSLDMLLIIPAYFIVSSFTEVTWFLLQLIMVVIICFGRTKGGSGEKN